MHNFGAFDWNDLRHFLAVARAGSTLAAAKVLRVNQSTVHRRLTALEECLGCALAERHPTGYRLTELGKQLQSYAEKVEDAVGAFQRHVASFDKGIRGTVRLTCSTGVAHLIMTSQVLDVFHARHPALKVELLMTESMFDLAKGEADVAIRGGQPKDEALIVEKSLTSRGVSMRAMRILRVMAHRDDPRIWTATAASNSSTKSPTSRPRAGCGRGHRARRSPGKAAMCPAFSSR